MQQGVFIAELLCGAFTPSGDTWFPFFPSAAWIRRRRGVQCGTGLRLRLVGHRYRGESSAHPLGLFEAGDGIVRVSWGGQDLEPNSE